jgi:AraC-like DNA-binding protein
MVTSPTRPLVIHYRESSCGLIVKIERDELERQLCALTGASLNEPLIFDPRLETDSPFTTRYKRLLRYLVDELDTEDALGNHPALVNNIEDTVMTALLIGQQHNYSSRFITPPASAAERQVRDIEDYIRAHATEPLSIHDLVAFSGISGRSLFRAFQRHRRTSPMAFLRATRLELARDRLRDPASDTTVTGVAFDCGFEHLGRFSADYARRFGESPSKTLRTALRRRI